MDTAPATERDPLLPQQSYLARFYALLDSIAESMNRGSNATAPFFMIFYLMSLVNQQELFHLLRPEVYYISLLSLYVLNFSLEFIRKFKGSPSSNWWLLPARMSTALDAGATCTSTVVTLAYIIGSNNAFFKDHMLAIFGFFIATFALFRILCTTPSFQSCAHLIPSFIRPTSSQELATHIRANDQKRQELTFPKLAFFKANLDYQSTLLFITGRCAEALGKDFIYTPSNALLRNLRKLRWLPPAFKAMSTMSVFYFMLDYLHGLRSFLNGNRTALGLFNAIGFLIGATAGLNNQGINYRFLPLNHSQNIRTYFDGAAQSLKSFLFNFINIASAFELKRVIATGEWLSEGGSNYKANYFTLIPTILSALWLAKKHVQFNWKIYALVDNHLSENTHTEPLLSHAINGGKKSSSSCWSFFREYCPSTASGPEIPRQSLVV